MADLCKRGLHPDTPENTIFEASGRRRCRACRRAYKRSRYQPHPADRTGERNGNWKGVEAGYDAMHKRVVTRRGKAVCCQRCGADDPERVYEWANLTRRYDDPDDYEQMCRSCHRIYDGAQCGEKHPLHKLTWDDVHEIRATWHGTWADARRLGQIFGVTAENIRLVGTYRTWRRHAPIHVEAVMQSRVTNRSASIPIPETPLIYI